VIRLRNGFTIVTPCEVELTALFQEIWVNRCYAPLSLRLGSEDTVIDIGAHVGVFTIWAAAQFPTSRLVSVEPSPESFAILRKNCEDNRLTNVDLLQSACGGYTGTSQLYSRGPASMNTLYTSDALNSSFRAVCSVPVISLDDLLERFHIERPSLLKLDCEGAEYEILMNASDAVLRRLSHIVMEYHLRLNTESPQHLAHFLNEKGFETVILPPRSEEGGYLYAKLCD
jgi:FkbM family methyltransferase